MAQLIGDSEKSLDKLPPLVVGGGFLTRRLSFHKYFLLNDL